MLISSNNRIDRDGEIVSSKALREYVARVNKRGRYVGGNALLIWHGGDPIGKITECQFQSGFLLEIAKELPDKPVNLGDNAEPIMTTVKACWDWIEQWQDHLGVSQGFRYRDVDFDGKTYHAIDKYESSILPIEYASNPFTFIKCFR